MLKQLPLFVGLVVVLFGPLLLREKGRTAGAAVAAGQLIIVTPHDQAIREEFARAFEAKHLQATGERVHIDWRTPGGTSDAVRYIDSEFLGSFQNLWTGVLKRSWSETVKGSFANPQVTPAASEGGDSPQQQARRAFLNSNAGCGIDLFFGGGSYDFSREAAEGKLVDCGYVSGHPDLFGDQGIPEKLSGEKMWDRDGRWIGVCLSAFGICSNADALQRLGMAEAPKRWPDLANPRFFHEVALANPTQSASVNRTFELLIQEQILEAMQKGKTPDNGASPSSAQETEAIRGGWKSAMELILKIGANARYFTDSSSKISLDVAAGEAAAGMCIDFYGRFESEAVRRTDGSSRLHFTNAIGGTSFSADTIGLLRGAPHPALAREFISFVMSSEGQRLWEWRVGAPGGPERYSLRRLPILPALYKPEFDLYRSDPEVNPYASSNTFVYHGQWTGPLFRTIAFIVRAMCIDPHDELTEAWRSLIEAHFPPEATKAFSNVAAVSYEEASGRIRAVLEPKTAAELKRGKIAEVQLSKELPDAFRAQYRLASKLARNGQ